MAKSLGRKRVHESIADTGKSGEVGILSTFLLTEPTGRRIIYA